MKMSEMEITRKALGRLAQLGDLYDATTDTFVNRSLFSTTIPEDVLETIVDSQTKFELKKFSNRFDEKIKFCNVDPELAISIICGLASVSGEGQYFKENNEDGTEVIVSLLYNISTARNRFNVFNAALTPLISIDTLITCKQATHVVVGIDFGANAIVSLKYDLTETTEDSQDVHEQLMAQLQRLVSSISIQGETDNIDSYLLNESTLQFYSNVCDIHQQPITVEETIQTLQNLPNLIKNGFNGLGKPLSYALVPLTTFANYLNLVVLSDRVVKQIENNAINNILSSFSDLHDQKATLCYLKTTFEKHDDCVPADKKREILMRKAEMERTESYMKQVVAECVKDVRFERKGADELDFIKESTTRFLSTQNVDECVERMQPIIQKIAFINDATHIGAFYIGKKFSLEEATREIHSNQNGYVFLYSSTCEELAHNMKLFYELTKRNSKNIPCYIVDLDVHPNLVQDISEGGKICHIVNGHYVNKDVLKTYKEERVYCLTKCVTTMKRVEVYPIKRIQVNLVCPQSIGTGKCSKEKRSWFCANCESPVEYGFDGMFYCDCGTNSATEFKFRCNDYSHSDDFNSFTNEAMIQNLKEIESMPELNILVLGETGVGKSTWINGIANYLTFPTLKEASEAKEILCLIPTKFTLLENFQEKVVAVGSSANERNEDGQACTQHPMDYLFQVDDCLIRIIDTPGIGDPRGVEQDRENLENVLKFSSNFSQIHGICILLKPNNAKLHTYFRFCILEMLTHLNRSAVDNIMFCFTNTRSTFYKPGDTYPALKKLLEEINTNLKAKCSGNHQQTEILLSENTMYSMDNESFRFLCARRCNIEFSQADFENFSLSWIKSMTETNRMLHHIKNIQPHNTVETIKINEVRKKILLLAKPMAKISDNIAKNIRVAEEQKAKIMSLKAEELQLERNRMITQISISTEKVSKPQTVCTSLGCIDLRTIPGTNEKKVIYKTICHVDCKLKGVYEDVVGAEILRKCSAMEKDSGICRKCICPWSKHMHITYKFKEESVQVIDKTVEEMIMKKSKDRNIKKKMIATLEANIRNYQQEQENILVISSKFGSFLKKQAILPYNDAFEAHVSHELNLAVADAELSKDFTKVNTLRQILSEYAEKKKLLEDSMLSNVYEITYDDVDKLRDELMNLKLSGESFRGCFQTAEATQMAMYNTIENHRQQVATSRVRTTTSWIQRKTTMIVKNVSRIWK